jgi:iron complex outermembrane receptor protein
MTSYLSADADQITQDLRITSDTDDPFNYIAGIYYAKEEASNKTTLAFYNDLDLNIDGNLDFNDCLDPLSICAGEGPATPVGAATEELLNSFGVSLADFWPGGCQLQNDFDQERTSQAIYADTTYDLNEAVTLRLGLRYAKDETDLENFSARILGNDDVSLFNTIPGDPVDPYAKAADENIDDDEWTGKIGVDYTTEAGHLLYASASHGYRNGGFNAQAFTDPSELTSADADTLDAFEVGFKSQWLDGSLQLNGAAFSIPTRTSNS